MGTQHNFSIAFHSQIDGQFERTLQILEDMLKACVLNFECSQEKYLSHVEFANNNTYQTTIGIALYETL